MRYLHGPESLKDHFIQPEQPGPAADQVRFVFLGTNTLYIEDGATRILIDPNFTRPGLIKWPRKLSSNRELIKKHLQSAGINRLDAVLLTHTHIDHALDAVETARLSGAILAGSASTCYIGQGAGLAADKMICIKPGQEISLGKFRVQFLGGKHMPWLRFFGEHVMLGGKIKKPLQPPANVFSYKAGQVLHILVQHPQGNLLCLGSAGCFKQEPLDLHADILALGIGGLGLRSSRYIKTYFRHYARQSGAEKVILTHWDDFSRSLEKPVRFLPGTRRCFRKLEDLGKKEPEIQITFPLIGEKISLFKR